MSELILVLDKLSSATVYDNRDFQQAIATAINVHTSLYIYYNLLLFVLGPM
jgi:hypothetical protein